MTMSTESIEKRLRSNMKLSRFLGLIVLAAPCANNQVHAFTTRQPTASTPTSGSSSRLLATSFETEKAPTSRFSFLQNVRQAVQGTTVAEQPSTVSSNVPQQAFHDSVAPADPLWSTTTKQLGEYQRTTINTNARDTASLPSTSTTRRAWMQSMAALAVVATCRTEHKQLNLPEEQLAQIMINDIVNKKSLVTADITRSIYDEQATFKDGSDLDGKYYLEQWVRGCRMLFDASKCDSRLVEDTLSVTKHAVTFRFEEDLTFRGPFSPKCFLSGTVVMKRCPMSGLIKSYEEIWDKDVSSIVKSAKLQGGNRMTDLFMARLQSSDDNCTA